MWLIWLLLSGFFLILEIFTTGFFVFWFGIGSLFAMLTSIFTDNLFIQILIFVLTSTALILSTKPLVNKILHSKKTVITNAYTIIGKEALVIDDINPIEQKGQIKVSGEVWSAISENNTAISKGSIVKVVSIRGVKACVKVLS